MIQRNLLHLDPTAEFVARIVQRFAAKKAHLFSFTILKAFLYLSCCRTVSLLAADINNNGNNSLQKKTVAAVFFNILATPNLPFIQAGSHCAQLGPL